MPPVNSGLPSLHSPSERVYLVQTASRAGGILKKHPVDLSGRNHDKPLLRELMSRSPLRHAQGIVDQAASNLVSGEEVDASGNPIGVIVGGGGDGGDNDENGDDGNGDNENDDDDEENDNDNNGDDDDENNDDDDDDDDDDGGDN